MKRSGIRTSDITVLANIQPESCMTHEADPSSPFHAGEILIQERLDVRRVEHLGRRAIRPYMPEQHREFFTNQPFLVAAARDAAGRPWATILEGEIGFVSSPDEKTLSITSQPVTGDALEGALTPGTDLGLIGVELATRRRNRVNGRIQRAAPEGLRISVDQSFGNCPQHIHSRAYTLLPQATPGPSSRHRSLGNAHMRWIATADTFFIASGFRGEGEHPGYGMDASHRGGVPGFVEVLSPKALRFPDYPGNNFYNTLGNILRDGRAGLLFLDFASGSLLQITGRAQIETDSGPALPLPDGKRMLTLDIDEVVELPQALRLRWQAKGDAIRELRLIERRPESADSMSFVFEARDRGGLASFHAGQFLPIEVTLPENGERVRRCYSLTNLPTQNRYQITVKRLSTGRVSRYLHDVLEIGDYIAASRPTGSFTLPPPDKPVIFISAGIGITPMISMVQAALLDNPTRQVHFLHGARDTQHHPFASDLTHLRERFPALTITTCYSQLNGPKTAPYQHDRQGRLTPAVLDTLSLPDSAAYYICGPVAFAMDWVTALKKRGVQQADINTESFGAG